MLNLGLPAAFENVKEPNVALDIGVRIIEEGNGLSLACRDG